MINNTIYASITFCIGDIDISDDISNIIYLDKNEVKKFATAKEILYGDTFDVINPEWPGNFCDKILKMIDDGQGGIDIVISGFELRLYLELVARSLNKDEIVLKFNSHRIRITPRIVVVRDPSEKNRPDYASDDILNAIRFFFLEGVCLPIIDILYGDINDYLQYTSNSAGADIECNSSGLINTWHSGNKSISKSFEVFSLNSNHYHLKPIDERMKNEDGD